MWLFQDTLDADNILDRVDAYSIYSFYIESELEIGRAYSSPLHTDEVPSFALFEVNNTLLFKDHALGVGGTVFTFVKEFFGYNSYDEALSRINTDFELELIGGKPMEKLDKKARVNAKKRYKPKLQAIKILSNDCPSKLFTDYWKDKYGISKPTLDYYNATEPSIVQYLYKENKVVVYPKELTIAYRILKKYKIYTPFAEDKKLKFLNNFDESYIEGYLQLKYQQDFLIITKAMKEVMFFREHYDWDTVAGKSENTIIKRHMMLKLVNKYKYIFIWLDNDVAGLRATKRYLEEYPFLIPIRFKHKEKDPTDAYDKAQDKTEALIHIKDTLYDSYGVRQRAGDSWT